MAVSIRLCGHESEKVFTWACYGDKRRGHTRLKACSLIRRWL